MKLKKLLMCLLAASLVANVPAVSAMAAETDTIVSVTEDATQENVTDSLPEEVLTETLPEESVDTEAAKDTEAADTTENTEVATEEKETEAEVKEEIKEEVKKEKKPAYTKEELRLLSALIYCEAGGEPYAGKLAVGIVVENRKNSSKFPNSIKGVIYQKSQFGPARNGSLKKALKRYDSGKFTSKHEKECIKAAKAALNGAQKVEYKGKTLNMKGFYFFSRYVKGAKFQIAHHQFK